VTFALEQMRGASFNFGLFDFDQVSVDEISDVFRVESAAVAVHSLLEEFTHLITILLAKFDLVSGNFDDFCRKFLKKWKIIYLFQFLAGGGHSGEDAQEWHKVDGGGGAEQPETFLNKEHEAFEARVLVLEADVHDDRADDV
jgi:hypothetical protein